MTWTRLDDTWTDQPALADLTFDVRWHYLAMIQFCSRTQRYDGVLKMSDARRCSDVEEPAQAITALVAAELLALLPDGMVKVGRIEEHIPPPSVRESKERTKTRVQRHRLHKNGDHSECLPEHCDQTPKNPSANPSANPSGSGSEVVNTVTGEVTSHVTRYTGTGQDRTGQDKGSDQNSASERYEEQNDQFDLEAEMSEEQEVRSPDQVSDSAGSHKVPGGGKNLPASEEGRRPTADDFLAAMAKREAS